MKRLTRLGVVALLSFLLMPCYLRAQTPPTSDATQIKLPNIVPHSPDMASLGKFGNIPVGMFTGVPQISVPIYEFKLGDVSLPVSLNYHASGLKVEEMASNVGLDWALDAGGTVTCEVRGFPDFDPEGYATNHGVYGKRMPDADYMITTSPYDNITPNLPVAGGELYAFSHGVADGSVDSQPDLYTYSFPGHSGKFYFDEFAQVHTMPLSTLKIERTASGVITITDENGIKYRFGEIESTIRQNPCAVLSINNSWWLTNITLPNQQNLKLTYEEKDYSYPVNLSFTRNMAVPGNGNISIVECQNTYNMADVQSKRLTSIVSSMGDSACFIYDTNSRTDLPGANSLSRIKVLNGTNLEADYNMTYSYVGGRLRLEKVTNTAKGVYSFGYDASGTIPLRSSFAMDHWGYYNGQNSNLTLAPIEPQYRFFDGANREPDFNSARIGVLTRVTWPTGGSTTFDYELNDYFYTGPQTTYSNKSYGVYSNSSNTQVSFTVPSSPSSILNIKAKYDLGGAPPGGNEQEDPPCTAYLLGPNNYEYDFSGMSSGMGTNLNTTLNPGTYTLTIVNNDPSYNGYVQLSFLQQDVSNVSQNMPAGGLRIKRITDRDSLTNVANVKRYLYTNEGTSNSSGNINYQPIYTLFYTHYWPVYSTYPCIDRYNYTNFWKQSNAPIYTMEATSGGSVGYTTVTELIGENGEGGKTVYNYSFRAASGGSTNYPLVSKQYYDWSNGKLLKQTAYKNIGNNTFTKLSELTNYYSNRSDSEYWHYQYPDSTFAKGHNPWGVNINFQYLQYDQDCEPLLFKPATFQYNYYYFTSVWQRLDSTVNNYYTDGSATPMSQVTKFYYDNPTHLQVTRKSYLNSEQQTVQVTSKYPQDVISGLDANAQQGQQALVAAHIFTPELDRSITKGGVLALSQRTNFRNWLPGVIAPETEDEQIGANPVARKTQAYKYDSVGNVLEQSNANDVHEVYVWGYNNTLPVARVVGSTYATVIALVNTSLLRQAASYTDAQVRTELDKIRTGLASSAALVQTYTYKPGIGLTSETDPKGRTTFYEYDSAARLSVVRNHEGNIVKMYCYNYKGQLGNCAFVAGAGTSGSLVAGQSIGSSQQAAAKSIGQDSSGQGPFYNVEQRITLTRRNCGQDSIGTSVGYIVPAGKYSSTTSQEDADGQALAEVNVYGQNYANDHGGCVVDPATIPVPLNNQ